MAHDVLWLGIDEPTIEHLHLREVGSSIIADGIVVGLADSRPLRLSYTLHCDQHYAVERATIRLLTPPRRTIALHRTGDGQWTGGQGSLLPQLSGCRDVDIAVTPFTYTLPIRRLALAPRAAAVIAVAYVEVPSLALRAAPRIADDLARSLHETRGVCLREVTFQVHDGLMIGEPYRMTPCT